MMLYIYIYIYIYIYLYIYHHKVILIERRSLTHIIRPYRPSLQIGLLDSIYCSHRAGLRGSLNKFPDFFCMDTFIDSTHMKL